MTKFSYPTFQPSDGYMTERIRQKYIATATESGLLPKNAHRLEQVVSLIAPNDIKKPIQFWQLYSVLGQQRIVNFAKNFYERVFADEPWFSSVFSRIAGLNHHINTQSSMWIDVMGGGTAYHGGEYRLNFHHTHNAFELMNAKGAERWVKLMIDTLNDPANDLTEDPRVRPALNTFLSHFMGKYADEFHFENIADFGSTNPAVKRRINLMNMTSDAIEELSEDELKDELSARGVDVIQLPTKQLLINKALSL